MENAVGAHLLNHLQGLAIEVTCWRERSLEVDFVVESGEGLRALEVKSGRPARAAGLEPFRRRHPRSRSLVVGTGGMPLAEFFACDPAELLAGAGSKCQ